MSLESKVIKAVNTAFEKAGDLVGDFTLRSVATSFNPATSVMTKVNADTTVSAFFEYADEDSLSASVVLSEERVLWMKSTVRPKKDDSIIGPDSEVYLVLNVHFIGTYDVNFIYRLKVRA